MLWYAAQIREDEADELEYHKGLIEYLAMLISAEGGERVKQVRESASGESKAIFDNEFEDTLNDVFGRAPEFSTNPRYNSKKNKSGYHLTEDDMDVVRVIKKGPEK